MLGGAGRNMTLTQNDIRAAAQRLHQAEKTRVLIRQLSQDHPAITIDDAYAIQKAWIDIKVAEGRVVRGHKIGLTSKAMQSALGINEPDSGVLLDDMFFADGGLVPTERFIATRIEAELAFVMKHRLAGPDSLEQPRQQSIHLLLLKGCHRLLEVPTLEREGDRFHTGQGHAPPDA